MWKLLSNLKTILVLSTVLLALIFLDGLLNDAHGISTTVLINEVLYDPVGSDSGYEWIELYNASPAEIDITDWEIQVAGTQFKTSTKLVGEISSKDFFLICEKNVANCDIYVEKLGFQNGGNATDGIQILDQHGTVIDSLFYDSPNSNNLTDENGETVLDSTVAPIVSSGESLGRSKKC